MKEWRFFGLLFVSLLLRQALGQDVFYMEHAVSQKKAEISYREKAKEIIDIPRPRYCPPCTDEINSYCHKHLIHDHCCCDFRHKEESLPWIPHECYVGKEPCKSVASSCIEYREYRECCCDKILAEKWKDVLSAAITLRPCFIYQILLLLVLINSMLRV